MASPFRIFHRPYRRISRHLSRQVCASSTTTSPASPLLLKFRNDLKSAMKAKDTNRLNVLRGLLADINNASKTSKPVQNDIQILSVIRKRAAESKAAAEEFKAGSRQDLVKKEEAEVQVLEEYAGDVKTVGKEVIEMAVDELLMSMREAGETMDKGTVLKRLIGPSGVFDGKPVEKQIVVKVVQQIMAS